MEAVRLGPGEREALAALFAQIAADPASEWFHPHPFTAEEAARVCAYAGRDVYLALRDGGALVAYGMLRGWDAGYEIPSLGIYVAERARGTGAARRMMEALHAAARERGAPAIRLKVYGHNARARGLYESMGYAFAGEEAGQHVGVLRLR